MLRLAIALVTVAVVSCLDAHAQGHSHPRHSHHTPPHHTHSHHTHSHHRSRGIDISVGVRGYGVPYGAPYASAGRVGHNGRGPQGLHHHGHGFAHHGPYHAGYGGGYPVYGFDYVNDPYRSGHFEAPDLLDDPYFRAQHKFDSHFPGRYGRRPPLELRGSVPPSRRPRRP